MNEYFQLLKKYYSLSETLVLFGSILFILFLKKTEKKAAPKIYITWFIKLRRRPWLAYLLVGLLAFMTSALVSTFAGIPQPLVHDEFSYLLAADTFAQGRLANPTHPLWKHFETFHVIHHPTYASKYPPVQGLTLALGQVIFGHPIVGVWLSVGLACAGICWMLAGWVPLRWALIGSLLAILRFIFSGGINLSLGTQGYWSQSFWGGAVAALGGALVFGALPRIMKHQRWRDSFWLGLGLAILANSRPFEGLVASLPAAVILGIWLLRNISNKIGGAILFRQVVLPTFSVLLLTVLWMGYYNHRVTCDPLRMPYQIHEDTYGIVPPFIWQPVKPEPQYNHQVFVDFHRGYISNYIKKRSFLGWTKNVAQVLLTFWLFFFSTLLIPPLVILAMDLNSWRRWNILFPTITCTLVLLALFFETWFFPHYAAPVASLVFLLMVESLRRVRRYTWRDKPVGRIYAQIVIPVLLIFSIASFAGAMYFKKFDLWFMDRAKILQELQQDKERHLVIIRYGPKHIPHHEWVYNKADIDGAKVVWAREMGPEADQELLKYFKDRRVWLFNADQLPRRLVPYRKNRPNK